MSALDRLVNYSAKGKKDADASGILDSTTYEGVFLSALHKNGFLMYDDKGNYTELYYAIRQGGNQKVQAVAGSGKTTMMLFKIMRDIVTGDIMCTKVLPNGMQVNVVDRVFVGTFLKSGAVELSNKLTKWQSALGYTNTASQISFGTLHAEFKRCLNAMGVATPIAKASKLTGLLRKAINACNVTRDGAVLTNEDYRIIEGVITYYRGTITDARYSHPNALEYGLTPAILDMVVNQYKNMKDIEGVMDFDDLQELLFKYLYVTPNPAVQEFVSNRYKYMYLDEFQDTSQIQYEILRWYMHGCTKAGGNCADGGKLVVVGDVEQCIYSFRGSDINIMYKEFDNDFEAAHSSLSLNYRCPNNILDPVIPSINRNTEAKGIEIKPYKRGGTFNVYGCTNFNMMLQKLSEGIDDDMNLGRSVGILCRTNYDGLLPALYLEISGKYKFSVSGDGMTLDTPLPKKLAHAYALFTERGTNRVRDILNMFVPHTRQYSVKQLCETMKANRLRLFDIPKEDLMYSCEDVYNLVTKLGTYENNIQALRALYRLMLCDVFYKDNTYCESARSIIGVLLYFIDAKKFTNIHEYAEAIDVVNERLHGRVDAKADISIATVHEFKGKERASIYVWNDSEGVFPSSKTDVDDLTALEEERRVHYIACTRAKEKCTILTQYNHESMFLNEMDCEVEKVTGVVSGTLSGKGGTANGSEESEVCQGAEEDNLI